MERLEQLPLMTKEDFEMYIGAIDKVMLKVKRHDEDPYKKENIAKLNRMAEYAIFRYYNQPLYKCLGCGPCNLECDNCTSCGTAPIED